MDHKVKVTIKTVRRRTFRLNLGPPAHCAACGREVETLTRRQAREILEVSDRELASLVAAGDVHRIPTISGSFRICKDSLFVK